MAILLVSKWGFREAQLLSGKSACSPSRDLSRAEAGEGVEKGEWHHKSGEALPLVQVASPKAVSTHNNALAKGEPFKWGLCSIIFHH